MTAAKHADYGRSRLRGIGLGIIYHRKPYRYLLGTRSLWNLPLRRQRAIFTCIAFLARLLASSSRVDRQYATVRSTLPPAPFPGLSLLVCLSILTHHGFMLVPLLKSTWHSEMARSTASRTTDKYVSDHLFLFKVDLQALL